MRCTRRRGRAFLRSKNPLEEVIEVVPPFGGVVGIATALSAWLYEDEPRIPVVAVGLGTVAAVAAARFAYRRGVEGYMALLFLIDGVGALVCHVASPSVSPQPLPASLRTRTRL